MAPPGKLSQAALRAPQGPLERLELLHGIVCLVCDCCNTGTPFVKAYSGTSSSKLLSSSNIAEYLPRAMQSCQWEIGMLHLVQHHSWPFESDTVLQCLHIKDQAFLEVA